MVIVTDFVRVTGGLVFETASSTFSSLILLGSSLVMIRVGVLGYFSPHAVARFWVRRLVVSG